jgi:hypothetical protein
MRGEYIVEGGVCRSSLKRMRYTVARGYDEQLGDYTFLLRANVRLRRVARRLVPARVGEAITGS